MPARKKAVARKNSAPRKRGSTPHHTTAMADEPDLSIGDKVPDKSETKAVGAATMIIKRGTEEFKKLVRNDNKQIVFKDEEKTSADRMMTPNMQKALDALATAVAAEWTGVKLRGDGGVG